RRLGSHVVILVDHGCSATRLDFDRYDFFRQPPLFPRLVSTLLTAKCVAVLLFACNPVIGSAFLRGLRHEEATGGVSQPFVKRILESPLPKLQSGTQSSDHVWRLAHVLDAAS